MDASIELVSGVRAIVNSTYPIKEGTEIWRVLVKFISDIPEKNKVIKDYYIWITGEYLEDKAKLQANTESAENFALTFAKRRFGESGNQVPIENGVSCSLKEGIVIVNPKEFIHPAENE